MSRFIVIFFVLFCSSTVINAEENQPASSLPDLKDIVVAGPYCGIYSLYACLDTFGKKPPVQELLKPEYVGSYQGSTAKELINAVEKFDLHGKCYANITWRQLQGMKSPMILHFRGSGDTDFNHWVAFLGIEGNMVRIIDVPHELAYISMAELLAQWDGVGIVVSDKPIQDEPVLASRIEYLYIISFIFGGVFLFKTLFWSEKQEPVFAMNGKEVLRKYAVQTVSLLGIIGFVAVVFHSSSDIGFLKNPTAVAEVTQRYYAVNVPEISTKEMDAIAAQKSATIFDARFHRDFELGCIPGATSMPINSNLSERQQILSGVDKTRKIVVYCQSSECSYSDNVAAFLKFNGYRNLYIYRGGYQEWQAKQQSAKN